MNHEQMGLLAPACVMWIFNATPRDFVNVFGEVGHHLWNKFEGQYERQEGQLICGLDYSNAQKLAMAAWEKYGPELLANRARAEEIEKAAEAYFATKAIGGDK
jgi:hypothetical protein